MNPSWRATRWTCGAVGLAVLSALLLGGCPTPPTSEPPETVEQVAAKFPTSLHGARPGKATFYSASDGFGSLTGIPITELGCTRCHATNYADGTPVDKATYTPGCRDCHADPANPTANPVTDDICLGCHGRQAVEQKLFADVHREAGMGCTACHTKREMHGDGTPYSSFLALGASDAACENCHSESGNATPPGSNAYHDIHGDTVHCSACHVKSVSSCYNCHFETEVQKDVKRFFAQTPRTGFKMLLNYNGKVHTGTFQALSYQGKTFVAIAPFFGHSITKTDIACGDCHRRADTGNENLSEYFRTGKITVTKWDGTQTGASRLVGPSGVIPIPPDWKDALLFDFLDYTGSPMDAVNGPANLPLWQYLKTGADGMHMVFGTPLTQSQISALSGF